MPVDYDAYETVVGLEVHVQLLTESKLFCGDSTAFGAEPNTNISAISLAHPGTLPVMNQKAIAFAIKIGLACQSEIARENYFARKNYFYPDLPKGYQLSQHTTPICKGGHVVITANGSQKEVRLNRIHLEEDAGKSLHDVDPDKTCIDFNRAGVPLIELVTEPDIRSGEEASTFLAELRKLVRYLEISDGNMEHGSLRCDANISVRKKGSSRLGTKIEVKNLNSIRNVKRAIEFESSRLVQMLEKNIDVLQQTRSFDADSATTFPMRDKEDADDYRYFPDPDLAKFSLTEEFIESVKNTIPALQPERMERYCTKYNLSQYDASLLTEDKYFSDYFEEIVTNLSAYGDEHKSLKAAANWMLGPVKYWMNERNADIREFPVAPKKIADIIKMIEVGKLSFSIASTRLFNELIKDPQANPTELAENRNWLQHSDSAIIEDLIEQVLRKFPEKVDAYKKGKKGLMGLFVGEVMKLSKGTADPTLTNDILAKKLKS